MKKNAYYIVLFLSVAFVFASGQGVLAQTEDTTDVSADEPVVAVTTEDQTPTLISEQVVADEIVVDETVIEETVDETSTSDENALEGIQVDTITEVPSGFGLWFRGVRERVSLVFTFDIVKKAEKQLKFAEERQQIAERILEKSDDPKAQERAAKVLERSQQLIERVEARKEKLLENVDERTQRLFRNVATHAERADEMFDRMEQKLPEEALVRMQELRQRAGEKNARLLNAINNEHVPEAVREHLQEVKDRIEAHAEEVKTFREETKMLREAVKEGDETAREVLKAVQDDRREEIKVREEERKTMMETRRGEKEALREAAKDGDEDAISELKKMNIVDRAVQEKASDMKDKRDEKMLENIDERKVELKTRVESGDTQAGVRLERVEKVEARVEKRVEARDAREGGLLDPLPPEVNVQQ